MVILFDGNDPQALALAREQWRALKEQGHDATYWQQDAARALGAQGLRRLPTTVSGIGRAVGGP